MKQRRIRSVRRERGQQLTEFTTLTFFLIVMGLITTHFCPDMLMLITIYLRGFYVVLGYPLG